LREGSLVEREIEAFAIVVLEQGTDRLPELDLSGLGHREETMGGTVAAGGRGHDVVLSIVNLLINLGSD
jgi:hypothetical protein